MSSQASGVDVMDCTSFEGAGNGADGGDALPESYVTTSNTNVQLCLKKMGCHHHNHFE